jgi:hypothetical protein
VAIIALIYTSISNYWNRHESRLDALSKVLQPMWRAAQHLYKANQSRQKCERLRIAFPDAKAAQEAAKRLETFMAEYAESIKDSEKEFRLAESEFAARSFRFPDKITLLTKKAFAALSGVGNAVNDGHFTKADMEFITFKDYYKSISDVGRGWRLADPLEGIRQRFKKQEPEPPESPYALSDKEMQSLMELVNKRAMSQAGNSFAVHPPRKLLEQPAIAESDRVIDELADSVFVVVFQDGTSRMLSLVELMVFTYHLLMIKAQALEVTAMLRNAPQHDGETQIKVKFNFKIEDVMRPEMVKFLLGKIEFSRVASDDGENEEDPATDGNTEHERQEQAE